MTETTTPTASVVICAHTMDRLADIQAAVESVEAQNHKADELILVIDHNKELFEKAHAFCDNVVMNDGPKGLSGARNCGTELATSTVVAYLDDDATADADWLGHLVAPFTDEKVVAVGGWAFPNWDEEAPEWFPAEFNWVIGCSHKGLPTERAEVRNVIGCNMAFRRQSVLDAGGFEVGLGRTANRPLGCEETELCIRMRQADPEAKILLEPKATISHRVPAQRGTWQYFFDRCRAEGNSKAYVVGLVGSDDGLDSERSYVQSVLPKAVLGAVKTLPSDPRASAGRAAAIVGGLAATTGGYLEMKVRKLRR